ncbi:CinA family protein [Iamia sp. SCSIO 61187]|nr:CinA family protein [Iamia sp. SCSIO 61187]
MEATERDVDDLAQDVADAVRDRTLTVAVAESLTGGLLANALARAEEAGSWFRGGVVAYASEVKHEVLRVRPGPVVAEDAAAEMARHVAATLGADVGVAVTGVGGPDEQDGQPPGTVWMAVSLRPGPTTTHLHRFAGEPADICDATVHAALGHLLEMLTSG